MTNEIFQEYGKDPVKLCKNWLSEASKSEINDPEAVCLATASPSGHPSARMVLIKEINEDGFKFHTNEESQKGTDLRKTPYAQMCFYWKSTRRQVRITGIVNQVLESESNEYFTTRPIERQIGAWASKQSQPFEKREDLEKAVEKYTQEFAGQDNIPRPPYWKGYRLKPTALEFWIGHEARVHTRFVYKRHEDGDWIASWLCP